MCYGKCLWIKPKLAGSKRWWVGRLQSWLWSWTWDFRKPIRPRKLPVFRNRKSLILESRIEEILLVESRILDFGIKESHGISLTMESSLFGINKIFFGCAPFGEFKNRFLILDLPDFLVERNAKSEIDFNLGNLSQTYNIMHDSLSRNGVFCTVWQIKRLYGAEFCGRQ